MPNALLREARLRTPSRGEIRWPNRRYREALRAILGAKTYRELGARYRSPAQWCSARRCGSPGTDTPCRRARRLGRHRAQGGRHSTAGGHRRTACSRSRRYHGDRGGAHGRSSGERWSFAHGGEFALRAGEGPLRWATQLLAARCPERLSPALHSAVSRLADACGFAAFDTHAFGQARRMLGAAHLCAEAGGNWALRASALSDTALVALWLGKPDEALTYTDLALVRAERLAPAELAMVWATQAAAHAQMGDIQATLAAIGRADAHFSNAGAGDETPLTYYTSAEHDLTCGRAFYELARTRGVATREAVERQLSAIAGFGDEYARSRALAQARLAVVVMLSGDPDEAAGMGLEALTAAGPIRSARIREFFQVLDDAAAKHSGRPVVDHLRERTAAFLGV